MKMNYAGSFILGTYMPKFQAGGSKLTGTFMQGFTAVIVKSMHLNKTFIVLLAIHLSYT